MSEEVVHTQSVSNSWHFTSILLITPKTLRLFLVINHVSIIFTRKQNEKKVEGE